MAYADDVTSIDDADRIDLYRFDGPQVTYAHTSGTRAITVATIDYAPLAGLRRGPIGASSSSDKKTLTVTMSGACDLAVAYAYTTPPRSLRLRIYEYQRNSAAAVLVWDGEVTAVSARGLEIEVRSSSQLSEKLATPVPGVVCQRRCPHILGDQHCRVDMEASANKHTTTVSSVSADGFTVTLASIGAFSDDDFRAGKIVRDLDGEARTITGQTGAILTLASPFRVLAGTNAVTLYVGCTKLVSYCYSRFDNVINFGGHPNMPNSNPFVLGLVLSDN